MEEKLLHRELSYQIQGAAIDVRKQYGSRLKEIIYQNALEEEFESRHLKYRREPVIQIFSFKTEKVIGSYRPDFIFKK